MTGNRCNQTGPGRKALPIRKKARSGALGQLIALGEAFPDLKVRANFQSWRGALADVEAKLAAAHESFPAALFAGSLGFAPFAFSALEVNDRGTVGAVPAVTFDPNG